MLPSGFKLVSIDPTQNRPLESHFPSFNRLPENGSGCTKDSKPSLPSQRLIPLANATTAHSPFSSNANAVGKSEVGQSIFVPLSMLYDRIFFPMMSTQYRLWVST